MNTARNVAVGLITAIGVIMAIHLVVVEVNASSDISDVFASDICERVFNTVAMLMPTSEKFIIRKPITVEGFG